MRFVPGPSLISRETNVDDWKEQNENDGGQLGRVYEPPKLVRVTLRPEEAVLGHCKTSTSGGGGASLCMLCRTLGS